MQGCSLTICALRICPKSIAFSCKAALWKQHRSHSHFHLPRLHSTAVDSSAEQVIYEEEQATQRSLVRSRLMLIDVHALMFRFHHSYGGVLQSAAGEQTSISYGVMKTLLDMLEVTPPPTHIAIVMDAPGKTFRHEMFKQYKAQRPPFPEEIATAIPQLTGLLKGLRVPLIREPGVEADDVIGTLALRALKEGFQVAIVSPDKDFFQLLRDDLSLLRTPKKDMASDRLYGGLRLYTSPDFEDEFGLRPDQWRDALALMGDTADNIPGVAGIGSKGAVELLQEFETLENLLQKAPEIRKKRQREALNSEQAADVARFSQALVTINTDLTVPSCTGPMAQLEILPLTEEEKSNALQQLSDIGFKEHIRRWKRIWAAQDEGTFFEPPKRP